MKKLVCKQGGYEISKAANGLALRYDICDGDSIIFSGFAKSVELIKQDVETAQMKERLDSFYPDGHEIIFDLEC